MNVSAVFDAMNRMSDIAHIAFEHRQVSTDIANVMRECGSCKLWMTRKCKREVHSMATGRYSGPSMRSVICGAFEPSAGAHAKVEFLTNRLGEIKARLDALTPAPSSAAGEAGLPK